MRKPIPGLDASFIEGMNGVFSWVIEKDWRPPKRERLKRGARVQAVVRNGKTEQERQETLWNDMAEW